MTSSKSLIGKKAPEFTLKDQNGQDYKVKPGETDLPLVLFFYPQSGSFGCTRQACQFRDAITKQPNFLPKKVQVVGISPDAVEKQKTFYEKEKLTYPILSDESKDVFKLYGISKGIWGLAKVGRVTFVIDEQGIIRDVHEGTILYSSHIKFVEEWLSKRESSGKAEGEQR